MKKILAMLIALMMLTATGMCFAETTEEPACIEAWDIVAMYRDGELLEEGAYPFISLFLYEDNTICVESGAVSHTGTFEENSDPVGYLATIEGTQIAFIYDEETGTLSMTDDKGNTGVFGPRADLPAELNAESIDDFQGTWHVTSVIKEGRWISLDSEEGQTIKNDYFHTDDPTIVIEGDKVNVLNAQEGTAEFVDGALVVNFPEAAFSITLTEGDGIVCSVGDGVVTVITDLYCDR